MLPTNRKSKRSYTQDWTQYNKSQIQEKERFLILLHELCQGIEVPEQQIGRPRLPLREIIFSLNYKVYSGLSTRRVMSDLREARRKGLLTHDIHFNSLSNYMKMASVTPCLKQLIDESSRPLRQVETVFAADSTGLHISRRHTWYNRHQKKLQKRRNWRKLHCICGVQSNIITCAEVSDGHAHDNPYFKNLVQNTARQFEISEVSADAGYLDAQNQRQVLLLGGMPYIAYRSNCNIYGSPKSSFWKRTLELFQSRQPEFMDHYYRRNNIESTFFMLKERFGERLRSTTYHAQVNEALCKVICHNLCVLIQSIYELDLEVAFWVMISNEKTTPSKGLITSVPERVTATLMNYPLSHELSRSGVQTKTQDRDSSTTDQLSLFEWENSHTTDSKAGVTNSLCSDSDIDSNSHLESMSDIVFEDHPLFRFIT